MKRLSLLLLIPFFLTAGCLKLDETLTLREDGSATLEANYAVSRAAITQLKAMMNIRNQMDSLTGNPPVEQDRLAEVLLDPDEDSIRREMKKYERYGIKIDRLKVDTRESWTTTLIKLSCRSLAEAARSDLFMNYGFSMTRNSDGNYVLHRASANASGESTGFPDADTLRLMSPFLEGFNVVIKVATPGRILKTTAPQKSQMMATWTFSFDKDPNSIIALQNQAFSVIFENKGREGKTFALPEIRQAKPIPAPAAP